MSSVVPWPAAGALAAGLLSLYFLRYLWPHRQDPGARFFVATICCEALWALSYGVALLTFDPALRRLFEVPIWLGINFIGVFFLAFALEYTGRGHLVRSRWMGGIVSLQAVHTAVVVTNPIHGLAWGEYAVVPVSGAAAVTYTHQPWLFVNLTGISLLIAAAVFLLFDTFVSYGPLYRTQAAAIALSPLLPGVAFVAWLFEVGGLALNLTPLTFPVHLGFDMYAFFRRDMFESTPAARRAGERAAIDDLGSAVFVVDDARRIIDCNGEARRLFGDGTGDLLGDRIEEHLPDVALDTGDQTVSMTTSGARRKYAVTTSRFADAAGEDVGYTVVCQDVTAETRREQRLAVLNRVLRHNLRNDLNVVQLALEAADERVEGEEIAAILSTAQENTAGVIQLGERARRIERALEGAESSDEPVRVHDVLSGLRADREEDSHRVEIRVPADLWLEADRRLLAAVFDNLIDNALEHNPDADARVEVVLVEVDGDNRTATFAVSDDGPGIPEHERSVIESGEETALEHGSGLGLWLVTWGVTAAGGDLWFEVDDDGTTVYLDLPVAGTSPEGAAPDSSSATTRSADRNA